MMKKAYLLIPAILVVVVVYFEKLGTVALKPMDTIDLSTLLFVFPIILALVERFNELFIIKKKTEVADELAEKEVKNTNFRWAVMASFTIGILLAIAGFRILETFITPPEIANQLYENMLFRSLDCILTGAVIAGGADGWHQLVGLFSDLTKAKRAALKSGEES